MNGAGMNEAGMNEAPIRYGYVGLGRLGEPLAQSLLRKGFALVVHDANRNSADGLVAFL